MENTEQIYRFQPTDEEGRPIGGEQVIKYSSPEELTTKLKDQSILLIRKLRQETKKNRLGIVENEDIPESAQRFNSPMEFNPRELSEDERYDISRRLLDPATAAEAASALVESQLGAPLDRIGKTLLEVQQSNINLRAQIEANAFVSENPSYYKCKENFESIANWIVRYNLAPVKENYQRAYETLKAQGVMVDGPAPVVVPEPVVVPIVVPVVEASVVPGIGSGLTRENSSDSGPIVKPSSDITYELVLGGQKRVLTGLQAINAMPSEEYKRRLLTDKTFSKKVMELENEAKARK